jgi:hypothetical protein
MPTLSEFLNNFGWKEILISVIIAAIIIAARESSPLGIFRRKRK